MYEVYKYPDRRSPVCIMPIVIMCIRIRKIPCHRCWKYIVGTLKLESDGISDHNRFSLLSYFSDVV